MPIPFTCIEACDLSEDGKSELRLYGASGTRLFVQSSSGASAVWPEEADVRNDEENGEGPPGKRVKLSDPVENTSNFSCLTITNDKKHLVAVTAEDKCIRVFSIDSECRIKQLSERCMARRPCAICVTADDSLILCADKFGDVYSLPLIPSPEDEQQPAAPEQADVPEESSFVPSASVLTVHSGRNRKVLEAQLKQAKKGPKKPKEAPTFKHDLLLGHVSMLTDIAYAVVDKRSYIITADRDEHVRVSRGPPQAHIIEDFCHGHEAFISRLCVVGQDLLVSGGGDPDLFVWDWLHYKLLQKLPIRNAVFEFMRAQTDLASTLPEDVSSFKVAVSGIWSVPHAQSDVKEILVACEGVPALFSFNVGSSSTTGQAIALSGNALDVTFVQAGTESTCTAIVSVDNAHMPGSTTEIRKDESAVRLHFFSPQSDGQWTQAAGAVQQAFEGLGGSADKPTTNAKALHNILYGVENLRKRPGSDD
ncbi:guanine-N(7)--methyltransferase subunit TRM82 [Sporormia fimetaria CBS 119925]|uniref:Guanine-N(7)--methyltransferase subunit TRM82 n=1 Tax=Sporormia fimetaria CBS 119925 TaxID=1340428 RepID=A0A6A6VP45_9PLEO|nr:guanine-N(7)--methyltransferase subunit TRM82 [Sporormia fimetaria CBS 119925]